MASSPAVEGISFRLYYRPNYGWYRSTLMSIEPSHLFAQMFDHLLQQLWNNLNDLNEEDAEMDRANWLRGLTGRASSRLDPNFVYTVVMQHPDVTCCVQQFTRPQLLLTRMANRETNVVWPLEDTQLRWPGALFWAIPTVADPLPGPLPEQTIRDLFVDRPAQPVGDGFGWQLYLPDGSYYRLTDRNYQEQLNNMWSALGRP